MRKLFLALMAVAAIAMTAVMIGCENKHVNEPYPPENLKPVPTLTEDSTNTPDHGGYVPAEVHSGHDPAEAR